MQPLSTFQVQLAAPRTLTQTAPVQALSGGEEPAFIVTLADRSTTELPGAKIFQALPDEPIYTTQSEPVQATKAEPTPAEVSPCQFTPPPDVDGYHFHHAF